MKFPKSLLNKIKTAPKSPGCYIFKDKKKKILYVGKAVHIYNRVNSYFTQYRNLDPKIVLLIKQIRFVEFITTDSELEALILETNLIKKYRPKYNRMMKDDKNYAWLMVTKGEDFPRLQIVRDQKIKTADYFGPFTDLRPIRKALKQLRTIFPYRSCNRKMYYYSDKDGKRRLYSSDRKPCLYYHLHLCDAPCAGFTTKKKYRSNINNIKRYFRSRKFKIVEKLQKEMLASANKQQFEKAAEIRDKIEDLKYITQRIQVEKDMDEKMWRKKKQQYQNAALENLIQRLKLANVSLTDKFRIECYDISNIQGKNATGSMVVFVDGKPKKSDYRKFKIKHKDEPDDFLMLREVFERRFQRNVKSGDKSTTQEDKSFQTQPDLLIVDGGKGQLSSTLQILHKLKLDVPAIGLAKREEEIVISENGKFRIVKLRKGSPELFLIQRIRDEAHRFALKYHRILRSKSQTRSSLDAVPGVGDTIKKRLLRAFGSVDAIKKAPEKELQTVVKNRRTVENLKKLL